ncbi:MAG TPA: recombinase family protein [Thermoanaerobaculia bacterium]
MYLRVSTDRQAQEGISLLTQEDRCLELATTQGYVTDRKTDIYRDEGESARSMDRPALMDLLARCKKDPSVRAVVVYDVSRLSRNRLDFALIKQTLRKAGVVLLSATEPINDSPEGQMLEGVLSTVAEFFSAQSGRKISASMRRKAEAGVWPAIAPYGYINRREKLPDGTSRAWIEPHPVEARWVRRAFELYATGAYNVKTLARQLNREGFIVRRNRNRKTKLLHHSHLERMLRKKVYVGIVEWSGIVNENGTHEPLVDPDLFYRVQDLLLLRSSSTTRSRRHRSLFKQIAFCGECGSAMTIDLKETSPTRSIRYLRCRKIQKGQPISCSQHYFPENVYTGQLGQLLDLLELPAEDVQVLRGKLEELSGEEKHVYERAKGDLGRQLDTVRSRQENLLLRSLDDDPRDAAQRSIYDRVRVELTDAERRLKAELSRLSLRLSRIVRVLGMALEFAGTCGRAFIACDDPDYQGLVARVVFKDVRMQDGNVIAATLREPLALFRRWLGKKTLESLADLFLLSGHPGPVVDGCTNHPKRHASLSEIKRDLLRLEKIVTPEEEAEIESCYYELCGRGILPGTYLSSTRL